MEEEDRVFLGHRTGALTNAAAKGHAQSNFSGRLLASFSGSLWGSKDRPQPRRS